MIIRTRQTSYQIDYKSKPIVSRFSIYCILLLCLQGGLRGDDPETTLTAFVLIALAEAKHAGISCVSSRVKVIHTETLLQSWFPVVCFLWSSYKYVQPRLPAAGSYQKDS